MKEENCLFIGIGILALTIVFIVTCYETHLPKEVGANDECIYYDKTVYCKEKEE